NIEKLPDSNQKITLVLDHLQLLTSDLIKEKLLDICYQQKIWLILISRSALPHWLRPSYVNQGFTIIQEEDLHLGSAEMAAYLQTQQLASSPAELVHLEGATDGNAYALRYATLLLQQGQKMGPEFYQQVWDAYADFLENYVFPSWDSNLLDFFMQLSVVNEFDLELAKMISGNSRAAALLDRAMETDNLLRQKGGLYRLSPIAQQALGSLAEKRLGQERLREYAARAALYYEMCEQFLPALKILEQHGKTEQIKSLLLHNAQLTPGSGYYFQMRRFYLRLSPEEISGSVVLMAGMSMLYSLLLQPEKSEYWYGRLQDFAASAAKGGPKREALSRLAYLDICLPHRPSSNLIEVFAQTAALLEKDVVLPEISLTDNLPSVLNGAKDFCWLLSQPQETLLQNAQLISQVLGPAAKGLLEAAQGEILYEQGGDTYEILRLLSRSRLESDRGDSLMLSFVAIALRIRLNMLHGDIQGAKEILKPFVKQVQEQSANHILPNLGALYCRIALNEGNKTAINRWLTEAPTESKEFNILERYRYLIKVRCYISCGKYLQAQALLEKLRYYAEQYHRPYIQMEVGLLSAIVKERLDGDWQQELLPVLRQASKLGFIRLISEEGAAVNQLLQAARKECLADPEIDPDWLNRLLRETAAVAVRYPVYLKKQLAEMPDFSETALNILRLQADGLSVNKIAEQLGMKAVTVKYHTRENYRKLGVSSKTDAVLAARNLGIL
ncbi:MAG: LuxR C-terminal-related transcriptional regulator, partial [Clostridium sp.]|nr:LuxR C-terminal-related transcriptional regulator [Clostridium sp.]